MSLPRSPFLLHEIRTQNRVIAYCLTCKSRQSYTHTPKKAIYQLKLSVACWSATEIPIGGAMGSFNFSSERGKMVFGQKEHHEAD
jgi:hypothetical protein